MANKYAKDGGNKGEIQTVNNILDAGLVMRKSRNYTAMHKHFADALAVRPQEICFYLYAIQAMIDGNLAEPNQQIEDLIAQAAAQLAHTATKPLAGRTLEVVENIGTSLFNDKNYELAADFLEVMHAHSKKANNAADEEALHRIQKAATHNRKKSGKTRPDWLARTLQQAGALTT